MKITYTHSSINFKAILIVVLVMFYTPSFFSQNTIPQNGSVGIGTTTPSALLDVNGNAIIDSSLIIKDSLEVRKKLKVKDDIRVLGKSVFLDKGKFKDDLVIDGLTKMNGDAKVFGDFKVKSLENTSLTTNRLLSITPTGKVVISTLNVPQDDTYVCNMVTPWMYANNETMQTTTGEVALCPNFTNVGIGTNNPDVKLHVVGSSLIKDKLGVGFTNVSDINYALAPQAVISSLPAYDRINLKITTPQKRSLFFVPKLNAGSTSGLSVKEDIGMFWTDSDINNKVSGFVLAPKSTSDIGMRIGAAGKFGFNTPTHNQSQYFFKSRSLVNMLLDISQILDSGYGLKILSDKVNDVPICIYSPLNNRESYRVSGFGEVTVNGDGTDNLVAYRVNDYNNTRDVFRVMGNGNVYATRVRVMTTLFPDYVFKSDYELMPLNQLEQYITKEKHLPNMPTAKEVEEQGADLGEINRVLVEKVEELTLYTISQQKQIEYLLEEMKKLKKQ